MRLSLLGALLFALTVSSLIPRVVCAQAEFGAETQIERPIASRGGDDPTTNTTAVDLRQRTMALETLDEALQDAPGTRVIRSGAYGSPTFLALRGSDAAQVEVLLDRSPLLSADGRPLDLSTLPIWLFERAEVYRGGAPPNLGWAGIGGVVRLVPRATPGTGFSGQLGIGSFGLFQLRAAAHTERGDGLQWQSAAGFTTSTGNFPFIDDANTALTLDDDEERLRENTFMHQGAGMARLRVPLGPGTLTSFVIASEQLRGVPGPANQRTYETRQNETHILVSSNYEEDGEFEGSPLDWTYNVGLSLGFQSRRFSDPFGEIGLPRITDDKNWRLQVRAHGRAQLTPWLEVLPFVSGEHESLSPSDARARIATPDSSRHRIMSAFETRFFDRLGSDGMRYEIRPSVRVGVAHAQRHSLRASDETQGVQQLNVIPSGRLGVIVEPIAGWSIGSSFSTATRLPSMIELFGDRGYLVGNVNLRPERGESLDLSSVLQGRLGVIEANLEIRGFVRWVSDLIRYRRNAQFQAVAENIASAIVAGTEVGLDARITRHFSVLNSTTLMHSADTSRRYETQLPLRPIISSYTRSSLHLFALGHLDRGDLFADLQYISASYADPANLITLSERLRCGAGISMQFAQGRLRAEFAVQDIFDQRGTDLLGFPLPGRSVRFALQIRD